MQYHITDPVVVGADIVDVIVEKVVWLPFTYQARAHTHHHTTFTLNVLLISPFLLSCISCYIVMSIDLAISLKLHKLLYRHVNCR